MTMTDDGEPDNIAYDRHVRAGWVRDLTAGGDQSKAVSRAIDFVARVTALGRARRILEIGTGPGDHARKLAGRGYKVVATEVSTALVEYARTESRRQGRPVAFLTQDLLELDFPPYFDLILNFCTEAPLALESDERVQAALLKCRDLLRPGGQFLFGRSDFRLRIAPEEQAVNTPAGLERHTARFDPTTRTVTRTITLEPEDLERPPVTWVHRARLYTLPEVEAMLDRASLAIRGLWHRYDPAATWSGPERPGRIILAERVR